MVTGCIGTVTFSPFGETDTEALARLEREADAVRKRIAEAAKPKPKPKTRGEVVASEAIFDDGEHCIGVDGTDEGADFYISAQFNVEDEADCLREEVAALIDREIAFAKNAQREADAKFIESKRPFFVDGQWREGWAAACDCLAAHIRESKS